MISRVFKFPIFSKRAEQHQFSKVTRGSRRCRICYGTIICGAQTSLKAIRPFREHAQKSFLLPRVDLAAKAVKQLRFCNQEVDPLERALLGRKGNIKKPVEPFVYAV